MSSAMTTRGLSLTPNPRNPEPFTISTEGVDVDPPRGGVEKKQEVCKR